MYLARIARVRGLPLESKKKTYVLIEIDETATNQSIEYLICCLKKDFPETAKKIRLIKGIVPE